MSLLRLDNVCKSYGTLKVTDHVTLEVAEGEALGIIGPNGAGKSTLFDLITGRVAVDAGTIAFAGSDVTGRPATHRCRLGLGRSFQIPRPFGRLTVFENLVVGAAFGASRSESEVTDRCADILRRTGLLERANTAANQLPLLQRKRLELARALATEPKLLLLDEIAGGLTESECRSLVETIRAIHEGGTTIVWIEHVLHALTSVVERLVVLDFGRIIADGKPDAVMASREVREIYLGIEV
ncbi:ABC transporter ATP-binding protein [Amorphus orientalis]|uniref:Branched-chain amino acid transport system ATP-binding protein n=1 Tax=Amorphus orientalis TaxID=649198 RepID=A0AAE3VMN1_9HYPH|nr:ABC transporter ATP-binding protein [Amorphus orientalis]MDQ0314545.1 branched-chain amino acid transport system ATP-binding protein [Amorphus orientalis]